MTMLDSYPGLAMGHGDEGRGDGIWQGITLSYDLLDVQLYNEGVRCRRQSLGKQCAGCDQDGFLSI
jgi:hypothetical protein